MKFRVALIVVLAVGAQAQVPMIRKMNPIRKFKKIIYLRSTSDKVVDGAVIRLPVKYLDGASVYPEATIVGGTQATRGQFPHQAHIVRNGRYICGGSLITTRWVMTAGHCVKGSSRWDVTLGATNRGSGETGTLSFTSLVAVAHENYDPTTLRNDIGVIDLGQTIVETEFIKVVNLPTRAQADLTFVDSAVLVSGWGETSDASSSESLQLNYVMLRVITNAECSAYYSDAVVNEATVCCISDISNESPCHGDSGGPLILDNGATPATQVGVVSFVSSAGCESGAPSGYERTGSHLDWLAANTDVVIRP